MNKLVLIILIVFFSFSLAVFAQAQGLFGTSYNTGNTSNFSSAPPGQCPNTNAVNDVPLNRSASSAVSNNTYVAPQNSYSAPANQNYAPITQVNNSYNTNNTGNAISFNQNFYSYYSTGTSSQGLIPRYATDPYGLALDMVNNINHSTEVFQPWQKGSLSRY